MLKEKLQERARDLCPEEDRKRGKCGCRVEARIGQTNLFPIESTDLICHSEI
jgi:hypothetical protein